jgi:hypothetical protein
MTSVYAKVLYVCSGTPREEVSRKVKMSEVE